jgi:hypothetical protein
MAKRRHPRVKLIPVQSSGVNRVGYDYMGERLFLEYEGGKLYEYFRVPEERYDALMSADSIGRYVNYEIKPYYRYRELPEVPRWMKR